MPGFHLLLLAPILIGLAVPALAADHLSSNCLNKEAQRQALASGEAVPLAQAIATVKTGHRVEVVRARLCREDGRLAYVLTLLARNGKVSRATIDAANGSIVSGR
jgi:uncharacterized membrane protein YkoI